jgi:predicted nuclease of predicted toxin-antitoxin system
VKLLADQDVYQATVEFLRQAGFDVVTARGMGLDGASDIHLLRVAYREKRVPLTRDKGFGSLVFLAGARTWGASCSGACPVSSTRFTGSC